MKLPLLALLFLGVSAHAAPERIAKDDKTGESVTLHSEAGPCRDGAKVAVYRSGDGKQTTPGCYKIAAGIVFLTYIDGDIGKMRESSFKKVDEI